MTDDQFDPAIADDRNVAGEGAPRCPWCSAVLETGTEEVCPSCRAKLIPDDQEAIPGLTEVEAGLRAAAFAAARRPKKRSGLVAWLAGDEMATAAPRPAAMADLSAAEPAAVAPPDDAVRREMLRLELEAAGLLAPAGADDREPQPADGTAAPPEAEGPGATTPPDPGNPPTD